MRYWWFWLCFAVFYGCMGMEVKAQVSLQGQVIDAQTGEPLSYVNIGIVNGSIGTVSGVAGEFKLTSTEALPDSSVLRFSMIGYTAREWQWNRCPKTQAWVVELTPVTQEIETITVVGCTNDKLRESGNKTIRPIATMGWGPKHSLKCGSNEIAGIN